MQKKQYYDPLLDKYFSYDEVKDFDSKEEIKDNLKFKSSANKAASEIVVDLANNYNYEKVLVGSYGETPFYALVDREQGVCIPVFNT